MSTTKQANSNQTRSFQLAHKCEFLGWKRENEWNNKHNTDLHPTWNISSGYTYNELNPIQPSTFWSHTYAIVYMCVCQKKIALNTILKWIAVPIFSFIFFRYFAVLRCHQIHTCSHSFDLCVLLQLKQQTKKPKRGKISRVIGKLVNLFWRHTEWRNK